MARRPIDPASHRCDVPKVTTIKVETAVRLVTLQDPAGGLRAAKDAFCRLQPTEPLSPGVIESWRHSVAKVARAVKVLPGPRAETVSQSAHRPEHKVGTIRQESIKIARETGNEDVLAFVTKILDEVGA